MFGVLAAARHLAVDRAGHDVARRQRLHRVVLVHELLARLQAQDGPEAAHGLRDEEVGFLARVVERRGVELDEFHVLGDGLGAVAHGDAVARGDDRIRGRRVDVAAAARGHDGELREHRFDLVGLLVEDVGAEAGQPPRVARDELAQVVLRQQVDGEVVLQHGDVRVLAHRFDERPFDLGAREVLVVEDAVFGVAALAVELEASVGGLVEARAPGDEVADELRRAAHDQLDGLPVTFAGAADERVLDVFLEGVGGIRHRADAALRIVGVALLHLALGDDRDVSVGCGLECERQACRARADDQKVGFHSFSSDRDDFCGPCEPSAVPDPGPVSAISLAGVRPGSGSEVASGLPGGGPQRIRFRGPGGTGCGNPFRVVFLAGAGRCAAKVRKKARFADTCG